MYKNKDKETKWREKHREALRIYKKKWDIEHPKNLAEHRKYLVRKHREYSERWKKYFEDSGRDICHTCGYNKCFAALDFHEVVPRLGKITPSDWIRSRPPSEKNIKITYNWITLCSNCHRELHDGERNDKN